jgi:hypothetical protein
VIGEAVATAARRLGDDHHAVLARLGGPLGEAARAAAFQLARLDPAAQKLQRARWMAASRLVWPENFRAIHPTWIEAALVDLPARARSAVANGTGDPVDIWLARRALAGFIAMPPLRDAIRAPADVPAVPVEQLRRWLETIGADQLARALAVIGGQAVIAADPRLVAARARGTAGLGPQRAVVHRCSGLVDEDTRLVRAGIRTVAPHLDARGRRQVLQRLPRALALELRADLHAFAADPQPVSWAALI